MALPVPEFSKRYLTQVEAERQYVLHIQEECTRQRDEQDAPAAAPAALEEAYRSARAEHGKGKIKAASFSS